MGVKHRADSGSRSFRFLASLVLVGKFAALKCPKSYTRNG